MLYLSSYKFSLPEHIQLNNCIVVYSSYKAREPKWFDNEQIRDLILKDIQNR